MSSVLAQHPNPGVGVGISLFLELWSSLSIAPSLEALTVPKATQSRVVPPIPSPVLLLTPPPAC